MASGIIQQAQDLLTATGNALTYAVGQCTRWVSENASWVGAHWGNAYQWLGSAQAAGLQTSSSPAVGSVAVWGQSPSMPFGHVALVQSVSPAGIIVSEENWLGSGITDTRSIAANALGGIKGFILPPGGAAAALGSAVSDPFGIGSAIAGFPAQVGHGLANAGQATVHNAATWAKNNVVGLIVALVVALVLFH